MCNIICWAKAQPTILYRRLGLGPTNKINLLQYLGRILIIFWLPFNLYAKTLTIAVTSSFASTFMQLAPIFEKKTNIKSKASYASSGQLATHIMHGAPIDVFLSADQNHIIKLENAGLALPADRVTYAYGELVMAVTGINHKALDIKILLTTQINKIAVANPIFAPYGVATLQVFERTGLLTALKPKVVWGESVGQVASFIQSGNVTAGFIARSQCYLLQKQKNYLSFWLVPHKLYDPIKHCATRILTSKKHKAAKLFLSFLKTKSARMIMRTNGYIQDTAK